VSSIISAYHIPQPRFLIWLAQIILFHTKNKGETDKETATKQTTITAKKQILSNHKCVNIYEYIVNRFAKKAFRGCLIRLSLNYYFFFKLDYGNF